MSLGLWIFLSTYLLCDTMMYLKGHNALLFKHRTPEEKAIRAKQTGLIENKEEGKND